MVISTRTLATLKSRTRPVKEFYVDAVPQKMELVELDGRIKYRHFILFFAHETAGKRMYEDIKIISEIVMHGDKPRFNIAIKDQYPDLADNVAIIESYVTKILKIHLGLMDSDEVALY